MFSKSIILLDSFQFPQWSLGPPFSSLITFNAWNPKSVPERDKQGVKGKINQLEIFALKIHSIYCQKSIIYFSTVSASILFYN